MTKQDIPAGWSLVKVNDGFDTLRKQLDKALELLLMAQESDARYWWIVNHATYGIDNQQRPVITLPLYAPDNIGGLGAAIDEDIRRNGE